MTRPTVLVVEDEPAILMMARVVLEREGYPVLTAEGGPAALAAFDAAAPPVGLVVLDVNIPGLTGWEVLAELRRRRPDLRVVLTTGSGLEEVLAEEPEELPSAVLPKPFRPADLVEVVASVLAEA